MQKAFSRTGASNPTKRLFGQRAICAGASLHYARRPFTLVLYSIPAQMSTALRRCGALKFPAIPAIVAYRIRYGFAALPGQCRDNQDKAACTNRKQNPHHNAKASALLLFRHILNRNVMSATLLASHCFNSFQSLL